MVHKSMEWCTNSAQVRVVHEMGAREYVVVHEMSAGVVHESTK